VFIGKGTSRERNIRTYSKAQEGEGVGIHDKRIDSNG
jgi:hypothetical protein